MPLPLGPPDKSYRLCPHEVSTPGVEPGARGLPGRPGQAVSSVGSAEGDCQALPVPVPKVPTMLR